MASTSAPSRRSCTIRCASSSVSPCTRVTWACVLTVLPLPAASCLTILLVSFLFGPQWRRLGEQEGAGQDDVQLPPPFVQRGVEHPLADAQGHAIQQHVDASEPPYHGIYRLPHPRLVRDVAGERLGPPAGRMDLVHAFLRERRILGGYEPGGIRHHFALQILIRFDVLGGTGVEVLTW